MGPDEAGGSFGSAPARMSAAMRRAQAGSCRAACGYTPDRAGTTRQPSRRSAAAKTRAESRRAPWFRLLVALRSRTPRASSSGSRSHIAINALQLERPMLIENGGDAFWYAHVGSGATPILRDRLPLRRPSSVAGTARSSSPLTETNLRLSASLPAPRGASGRSEEKPR
jgi:hypothetical protein